MKKVQILLAVALLVLLLGACAPQAGPATAPAAAPAAAPAKAAVPAAVAAKPVRAAWEEKLEETAAAAKKEGSPVLFVGFGGEGLRNLTNAFTNKYGVRIEASVAGTSQLVVAKISAEQRAGIYSGDVLIHGSASAGPFKGLLDSLDSALILPELTEPELVKKTWYFGELSWGDKPHTVMTSLMDVKQNICINTDLVKSGEIKAYRDLLDPKWKGKISIQDPSVSGSGQQWFAVVLELGDVDASYFRELVTRQELFVTRDRRLQVEALAKGKHAVALAPWTATVTEFIGLGAPLSRFALGTPWMSGGTSGNAIFKRAPHPNAARLFINWLLSVEGQTLHSKAVGIPSQRLDVPTSHLEAAKVLGQGLNVYRADNEEFNAKQTTYYAKLAAEIFGQ